MLGGTHGVGAAVAPPLPPHQPSSLHSRSDGARPARRRHRPCCAECGRQPRDDENAADEWRVFSDGHHYLHVFCPECAEREFGSN